MSITISTAFDSGNGQLLAPVGADGVVQLRIRADDDSPHFQWFHIRVNGARDTALTLRIVNANKASYPGAWPGYQAVASVDRQHWYRVPTTYSDGQLVIEDTPQADAVWYAYFAPYSLERHQDLVARAIASGRARHDVLGRTLQRRDLDRLVFGSGPRTCWFIARQHPGESMASWWMEGFIERLLDDADPLVRRLLDQATVHIVPHMNPDGSQRGHLRTNASGANLNREWHQPTMTRSPEVKVVRDAMDEAGCDFCLDVHGDEALPYVFLSGAEGIEGWTPRLETLQQAFADAYQRANPDLQQEHGYPKTAPGKANLSMCTNQVAQRFDCLAFTLEMPFKDNDDAPDPAVGWSAPRSARLGASAVDAVMGVIDQLR